MIFEVKLGGGKSFVVLDAKESAFISPKQAEAVAAHFVEAARRVREFRRPAARESSPRSQVRGGSYNQHDTNRLGKRDAGAVHHLGAGPRRAGDPRIGFPETY